MSNQESFQFEMDRLVSYDDESILDELRRVPRLLPPGPMTRDAFNKLGRMSEGTVHKRFGTWRAALEAAGLSERDARPGGGASTDDVIQDLKRIAAELGVPGLTMREIKAHGKSATDRSIPKHFRVLQKAFRAAELEVRSPQRRWTEDDYFENLMSVWTHYGRAPTTGEMNLAPSDITVGAYSRKFGTWAKAKQAFVDRVNADIIEGEQEPCDAPR